MSSRERMLLAINLQQADHVPLAFNIFDWTPPHNEWNRGLDDWISIGAPSGYHPDVKIHNWRKVKPDERYPLLFKEYETPKGTVSQVVYQTEDWPFGEDVPLVSDYNIPRSKKFPVEELADLEKIPYLFFRPSQGELKDFKEHVQSVKHRAQEHQVMVMGSSGGLGDYAAWLMGITNLMIYGST